MQPTPRSSPSHTHNPAVTLPFDPKHRRLAPLPSWRNSLVIIDRHCVHHRSNLHFPLNTPIAHAWCLPSVGPLSSLPKARPGFVPQPQVLPKYVIRLSKPLHPFSSSSSSSPTLLILHPSDRALHRSSCPRSVLALTAFSDNEFPSLMH